MNSSLPTSSYSTPIIDVNQVEKKRLFQIDRTSLVEIVKEKNLAQLEKLGGAYGVALALKICADQGISVDDDGEVAGRREAFGSNTHTKPQTKGFLHYVWESFQDLNIIVLIVSAAISIGFGIKDDPRAKEHWIDGVSILVFNFVLIAVSSICHFRLDRQFTKLSKVSNSVQIDVLRSGQRQQISIFEILVGDVICLKIGDQVPADGLFLKGHSLRVDESSMTGESEHVEINHGQNSFLFCGTKVVDGYGRMVVTSVGMNTAWGKMMSQLTHDSSSEKTPLQARLKKLRSLISKVACAMAFLALLILFYKYFTGHTKSQDGNVEFISGMTSVNDVWLPAVEIIAAASAVVATPERLPIALTLTLPYLMKKMVADYKAFARKLSACETMVSTTTICTNKTGILTTNQMKVTKFWCGKKSVKEEGSSYSSVAPYVIELFREGIALNTTGSVHKNGMEYEVSGSPTEKAILSWGVEDLNMDMEEVIRRYDILQAQVFNSERKRSGVLIKRKLVDDGTLEFHWKGAAETILAKCSTYYDASGAIKDLDQNQILEFQHIIEGMAAGSLRCIAFAHKQLSAQDVEVSTNGHKKAVLKEDGLVLLGLVGIKDPCRPGLRKAVDDCRHKGVNVKMITSDNVFTAKAIATDCGILQLPFDNEDMNGGGGAVIEGVEFRNLSPEERMERVDKICVMARSSPSDKLLMVQCLKQKGHVVALTGHGPNDALALEEADIGLSMGIYATQVAKESSDIVILDDNFTSAANVLKWSRCVYNNVQKFIQFQLTFISVTLVFNFVATISTGEIPLTAGELLWLNLIMNLLGALSLATKKPTKDLMKKRTVGKTEPLITNTMWINLSTQALYQICVLLTIELKGASILNLSDAVNDTMIFNTFVLCQVFYEFNARDVEKKNVFEGIQKNKLFMGIITVTIVLQVMIVEFMSKFAHTERLNWWQWGLCVGIAALSWPISRVVKCIRVLD